MKKPIQRFRSLLLLILLSLSTWTYGATNQPGVVLTFDDTSTALWHNFFANRPDANSVHATFFVTKWNTLTAEQKQQLGDLQNLGHEIGCHGYQHVSVGEYLYDPNRTQEYVNQEVLPAIQAMNADGFFPFSFSYPSGEHDENYDATIQTYLPYLRSTYWDSSRTLAQTNEIFHSNDAPYNVLSGASLDYRYGYSAGDMTEIKAALDRAKNNNEIVTFYGHYIFDDSSPDVDSLYSLRASKLNEIIDYAKSLGLKFYTVREAFELSSRPPGLPAPTNLSGEALSTSIVQLTWQDNSSDESEFLVERCLGAGCANFTPLITLPANTVSFTNTGLSDNNTYLYRVKALKGEEASGYSNQISVTTPASIDSDTPPPPVPGGNLPAPGNLAGTALSTSVIELSWQDNSSDESEFLVERCLGAGCTNFTPLITLPVNTVSFTNTGLSDNNTYLYRVRALRGGNTSDYSNEVTVTTLQSF